MTYPELLAVMEEHGVYFDLLQLDVKYVCPSDAWFDGPFRIGLEAELRDLGILDWQVESGDCDDLGCWGRAHAKKCNARMRKGASITIGEFIYTTRQGTGHSIVFGVTGKKRRLRFLDRVVSGGKTCIREVELLPEELESCLLWQV